MATAFIGSRLGLEQVANLLNKLTQSESLRYSEESSGNKTMFMSRLTGNQIVGSLGSPRRMAYAVRCLLTRKFTHPLFSPIKKSTTRLVKSYHTK